VARLLSTLGLLVRGSCGLSCRTGVVLALPTPPVSHTPRRARCPDTPRLGWSTSEAPTTLPRAPPTIFGNAAGAIDTGHPYWFDFLGPRWTTHHCQAPLLGGRKGNTVRKSGTFYGLASSRGHRNTGRPFDSELAAKHVSKQVFSQFYNLYDM